MKKLFGNTKDTLDSHIAKDHKLTNLEKYSRNYLNTYNTKSPQRSHTLSSENNNTAKGANSQINKRYTFNGDIEQRRGPRLYQVTSKNHIENDEEERREAYLNDIEVKRYKSKSEMGNYEEKKRDRERMTKVKSVISNASSIIDEEIEEADEYLEPPVEFKDRQQQNLQQQNKSEKEILVYPLEKVKNGHLATTLSMNNDYDDEDIFKLLVRDTSKFVHEKPRRGLIIQCRIKRIKSVLPEYIMYLETCGRLIPLMICSSKLVTTKSYNYIDCVEIGIDNNDIDVNKLERRTIGILKSVNSRFLADQFVLKNTAKKKQSVSKNKISDAETESYQEYLKVAYEKPLLKFYKPLGITIHLTVIRSENDYMNDDGFKEYQLNLCNKEPEYDKVKKKYYLDFSNRVMEASTHNTQIVHPNEPRTLLLQMGKFNKNEYVCDYTYPFTAFQAFGFALSKLITGHIYT